jgi:hypothetical protein
MEQLGDANNEIKQRNLTGRHSEEASKCRTQIQPLIPVAKRFDLSSGHGYNMYKFTTFAVFREVL